MHILTFDIEDWFHIKFGKSFNTEQNFNSYKVSIIEKNVFLILELLEKYNTKATFFILGWVATKYPYIVREIYNNGHEIGTHSHYHNIICDFNNLEDFKNDLSHSIHLIEDLIGEKVKSYRAPSFSYRQGLISIYDVFEELGLKIDSSIVGVKKDYGGDMKFDFNYPFIIRNNEYDILEMPLNYLNIFGTRILYSGGGHFRLFPTKILKLFYNLSSTYSMTYLHPRDFDPNQPFLEDLSLSRRFKSYYGLNSTKQKLDYILSNFKFDSISNTIKKINWKNARVENI
jgi:polysaccharide deacetylase family protein (PEP-CTERM system associated)